MWDPIDVDGMVGWDGWIVQSSVHTTVTGTPTINSWQHVAAQTTREQFVIALATSFLFLSFKLVTFDTLCSCCSIMITTLTPLMVLRPCDVLNVYFPSSCVVGRARIFGSPVRT
jgi:hypothetical protein